MKKIYKRGIGIIVLLAIGFFVFGKKGKAPEVVVETPKSPYTIETATIEDLQSASHITKHGTLKWSQEVSLSAKAWGQVTDIEVSLGDKVKKKEVVITLEDSNGSATFQQQRARTQLATAKSAYLITVTQANQWVTDAQSFLTQAQAQYNAIRQKGSSTAVLQVQQLDAQLQKAQLDYQTLLTSNKQTVANFITSSKNIASDIELLYQDITIFSDQILWVSDLNKQSNDAFEHTLWAQKSSTRREAQSELRKLLAMSGMYVDIDNDYTSSNLVGSLQWLQANISDLLPLLTQMETMFQYTIPNSDLSQGQIDGYLAQIDSFQAQAQGKLTAITEQTNAMQSFLTTYQSNERSAQQQVDLIKQQGVITESTLSDNELLAKLQVDRAQIAYNSAKENKNQNIAAAQNNVDQAQISYNEASDYLDKFEVRSTIDGTVEDILVDVGQEVAPGQTLVTVNGTDLQEIEISLSQEELAFVDEWQEVTIHNGAKNIVWAITSISSSAGKNFTYEALVEPAESAKLLGDLVTVEIEVTTTRPLIPLNVVTILNNNEGLINIWNGKEIRPLRVTLGKIRWTSVEIKTNIDEDINIIVSDIKNYNPSLHEIEIKDYQPVETNNDTKVNEVDVSSYVKPAKETSNSK